MVTFIEEILNVKLHFLCSGKQISIFTKEFQEAPSEIKISFCIPELKPFFLLFCFVLFFFVFFRAVVHIPLPETAGYMYLLKNTGVKNFQQNLQHFPVDFAKSFGATFLRKHPHCLKWIKKQINKQKQYCAA